MSAPVEFWIVVAGRVYAARSTPRGVEYRLVTNGREHWRLRPYQAADQRFANYTEAAISADAHAVLRRLPHARPGR